MYPSWKVGAAMLLAVAVSLSSTPLAAQQGSSRSDQREAPEVRDLTIRGVKRVNEAELRASIATEESSCNSLLYRFTVCLVTKSPIVYTRRYLDREELARDVLRIKVFYWRRGFRDAQVDTLVRQLNPDAVAVTFEVREGLPTVVGSVAVTGVDALLSGL